MELKAGPLTIILPERLNRPSVTAMRAALAEAGGAGAIVLEGEADRFCLGMDFVEAAAGARDAALQSGLQDFAGRMETLLNAPRPTLAVIDGPALGGGLGLAAACDFVLATSRAQFGLPEALYGLTPAIIRPALLTRLTPQKLNMLLFTCHARNAMEAHDLGLADRVVEPVELEKAKREILRQFRRARSESVIAARRWNGAALAQALQQGAAETGGALLREEVTAALRAANGDEDLPWRR